jgi:hypothetical protein
MMRINKKTLYALISCFFSFVLIFLFIISSDYVFALSSNYNKGSNEDLSVAEWNELANDFLAKSGEPEGVMLGELDLNNNSLINVGNYSNFSDVVNKGYVNSISAAAGGGTTFVNWGREDCPSGTENLYNGFAFGVIKKDAGGSSNNICIKMGTSGGAYLDSDADKLYPLVTTNYSAFLPSEISDDDFVKCSVCYKSSSSCYMKSGDWSCDGSYSPIYEGYHLGAIRSFASHYTSRERICVNRNFDDLAVPATFPGSSDALLYGSRVDDNFGLSDFSTMTFLKCTVCCN